MPYTADDLRTLRSPELHALMARGFPVSPDELVGHTYHGITLDQPGWLRPFTWTKFMKCFVRDAPGSPVRGWNVRAVDNALDEPWLPKMRGEAPSTFGHFVVGWASDYPLPGPYGNGVVFDYVGGGNAPYDPSGLARDAVVAVNPGDPTLLLGCMWAELGVARLPLPGDFLLIRGGPVEHLTHPPRAQRQLTTSERDGS